jgi:hypothetical protein
MTIVRGPKAFRNHVLFGLALLLGPAVLAAISLDIGDQLQLHGRAAAGRQQLVQQHTDRFFRGRPADLPAPYRQLLMNTDWFAYVRDSVQVKFTNEPEGANCMHYFLECDRGTMTTKRFLTKLRGYWQWWRSGRQEEVLGIRNFRVLTVTATQERAENLLEVCRQVDAPRHRGLGMFLFASEQEYVGRPERVLEDIWTTPADDWKHGLLE